MSTGNATTLTPRETELLAAAWQCFEGEAPKVDITKLAGLTGYTEGSARTLLNALKTKLKKLAQGASSIPKSTPKKSTASKTPTSRGSKRTASSLGDVDDTPTKKKRTTKSVEKPVSQEQEDGHDGCAIYDMIKAEVEDDNDNFEGANGPDIPSL